MPYEIRQDDDDQYCVWKLEPDELLKCYAEPDQAGAYLAALNEATEDEQKARVGVDKYSTEEEAVARAEVIGCAGYHTLTEGGETIYMPCGSHADWQEHTGSDEAEGEYATTTKQWRVGAARDLPIHDRREWDADMAKARVFRWAGFDGDEPDPSKARQAFLIYDDENDEVRAGYKLPFADYIDGELHAIEPALRAAASRLPQTDIPAEDAERARVVLDGYFETLHEDDEKTVQIKAITDDHFTIAGYGVVYGGVDLEGDTFKADTDYMLDTVPEPIVLYDHAQEIKSVLGRVTKISAKEAGLWMEAQISRAKDYAEQVLELVKNGKLGYSTGSVAHLVERLEGNIKRWPVYELSLTPTPAEPRTLGVEYLKGLGVVIPAAADADAPTEGATLEGHRPESAAGSDADADANAVTKSDTGERIMSDETQAAKEVAKEVQPEAPTVDMDALKAEMNLATQDAIKNALEAEAVERGGILTEAPAVKKETKMGGDHDGGEAFMHWVKTGSSNYYTKSNLKAALQEGTATEGGVLVPQGLHETIIAKRDDLSVARAAGAMVIQTMVDSVQVPSENATGGFALTAEEGAANQDEPTFTSNAIQVYKFTNLTKVSDELLADEKTNLEGFLGDMWARSAADVENEYFLKGTGSSQPKGVLVGGTAALTLDSATTIAASEIPELFFLLPGAYANEGDAVAWATNQSTLAVIRGLTGDNFMFMPTPMGSGSRGPSQMLYGAPMYTSSQILAMASGRSVIVIGNWKYYGIVERNEIVISRNPYLYQGNGQVGFFVNIRFGGDVLQAEAFQYAQNA